jgi:hypothetical protein
VAGAAAALLQGCPPEEALAHGMVRQSLHPVARPGPTALELQSAPDSVCHLQFRNSSTCVKSVGLHKLFSAASLIRSKPLLLTQAAAHAAVESDGNVPRRCDATAERQRAKRIYAARQAWTEAVDLQMAYRQCRLAEQQSRQQ